MIITLSPSKGQDFETPAPTNTYTLPDRLDDSQLLIEQARQLDSTAVQSLMAVSENIANLNVARFQNYNVPFTPNNAKQCLFAFKGDVYTGLSAIQFTQEDMDFAQDHLRILSGLYGALRPLDLIQPYRLEMKTKLANPRGKDLYQFWGERITQSVVSTLENHKDKTLINLASNEYFKSIKTKQLPGALLNINFKEVKDGKARIIAIYAKHARGMMADYIIRNRIDSPEAIKQFDMAGYRFSEAESDDKQWTFTRPQPSKK